MPAPQEDAADDDDSGKELRRIIGWFLIQAAVDHDPKKTVGFDGVLQKVATQTYGRVLLGIIAIGLLAYALYRAVEARYRKV